VVSGATTYRTVVAHARQAPVTNRFRYRSSAWLVDLDAVPRLPSGLQWLARFDSKDHIGDASRSLRDNVASFLSAHGINAEGRLVMLANARSFGHVFNPISVFWCHDADGQVAAVVAEVHNTYGGRHSYLLHPAPDGSVDEVVDKQLYVSPFNSVSGTYRVTVSPPDERVSVSVTLIRDGEPPFVATLRGRRQPPRSAVRAAVSTAFASLRVSALIRRQGVALFLRGLRVQPRPITSGESCPG
jgi:DUF1365 family protein